MAFSRDEEPTPVPGLLRRTPSLHNEEDLQRETSELIRLAEVEMRQSPHQRESDPDGVMLPLADD